MALTHKQLCDLGARYLKQIYRFDRLLSETGYRKENPDVFAFSKRASVLIECKASRADFLKDKRKPFRQNPKLGVGSVRIYLVNEGVAKPEEIPEGWYLLVAKDENTVVHTSNAFHPIIELMKNFKERNAEAEIELMWSWEYRRDHNCLPKFGDEKVRILQWYDKEAK